MKGLITNLREHPAGSGRYELSFRNAKRKPNPKVIRFPASSHNEANAHALNLISEYKEGIYDPWLDIKDDIVHAASKFIEESQKHLRPNSINSRRSCMKLFLEHAHAKSFEMVNVEVISMFIAKYPNAGTKRSRLQILNQFFKWCISNGFTRKNPVQSYLDSRVTVPKDKGRREELTMKEYRQVYAEATNLVMHCDPWWPDYLELLICTGMRKNELLCLNIRNVQTDGITGQVEIEDWTDPVTGEHFVPKNEAATRVIPLVPRAAALFKQRIDAAATDDPWANIFPPTPSQKYRIRYSAPTQAFTKCRNRAGLGKSKTLHSTRHTNLSWLIALGIEPYTLKEIAGHGSLRSQERYIHFCKKMLGKGAAKVKRELLAYLCPGVGEDVLEFVFPDANTWYKALVGNSRLDIIDVLYSGVLYDKQFVEELRRDGIRNNIKSN